MVELLNGFPLHVVAFRALGVVSKEEYKKVVIAKIEEATKGYPKINFFIVLQMDVDHYTLGALLDYLKVSFEHHYKWDRMAIVSDKRSVRGFYDRLSPLAFGELKTYRMIELDDAKEWVCEGQVLTEKLETAHALPKKAAHPGKDSIK